MAEGLDDLEHAILGYRQVVSYRVRKALGGSTPDWEDVADEIILQALEKVRNGDFRGDSSVGTFIYTITTRRIIDHFRRKNKVLRHAPDPGHISNPDERLDEKERADLLARLITQLKPKYREVLRLYYYEELSREEVARRLGIPAGKVSERLHYAQKLLRQRMRS